MSMFKRVTPTVDAIQYTGDLKEAKKFLGIRNAEYDAETRKVFFARNGFVANISVSDWIVKEPTGVIVLTNAEFKKSFEPA